MSGRRGIANYGVAPTLGDGAWSEPVLEVHFPVMPENPEIPESPEELPVTLSFLSFIRPERRFPSLAALKSQIEADCASCRQ